MRHPTLSRHQTRTTVSSARPENTRARVGRLAVAWVLWVGMGLVFLGGSGCSLGAAPPTPAPFVTITRSPTPSLTPTSTQPPTRTQAPTPSPEFPLGSAVILHIQEQMSVQVTGQPSQFAEPGLTIPASGGTLLITGGIAQLRLSDSTLVYLGENTTVSLISTAGTSGLDTVIQIQQGIVLVVADQVTIRTSANETGNPFQAQVTNGWMGVIHQPDAGQFLVDCLTGGCQAGNLVLSEGQRGDFTGSILGEPGEAQYDFWQALILFDILSSTPTLTITSTPTTSLTPTPLVITSAPPTLVPTNTPGEVPTPPPPPPTPKPTNTSTSVPIATDTATSVSPP